jgi:hypothetical protein
MIHKIVWHKVGLQKFRVAVSNGKLLVLKGNC